MNETKTEKMNVKNTQKENVSKENGLKNNSNKNNLDKNNTLKNIQKEDIITSLKKCFDPELQMDVWTLGLIYDILVEENIVSIKMTFTTPFCPFGPSIVEDIKSQIKEDYKTIKTVSIEVVFEPPWQPTEEVKMQLGIQ